MAIVYEQSSPHFVRGWSGVPQSDPDAIRHIPAAIAHHHNILPVAADNNELTVAVVDPNDIDLVNRIRYITGMQVTAIGAPAALLHERIRDAYGTSSEDPPVVRVLDEIQRGAVESRASDIHIEPFNGSGRVRYRIDGVLHTIRALSEELFSRVVARMKLLAEMDIADKRQPQDGRYTFSSGDRTIDARVSSMPTIGGEKLVVRLLDCASRIPSLSQLGIPVPLLTRFRTLLHSPQGCIVVCGPTGSGKTTTLYSALTERNDGSCHICSVEDPVEMRIPGVAQAQVHSRAGLTFANAIRAMLRQDPDVMMIGEIRDGETAQLAMTAAVCGRLLLTTLHADDAPSAIDRFVELGVASRSLASGLSAIVAQRLMRRLCTCRNIKTDIDADEMPLCVQCGGDGFHGREATFELMVIDDELRAAIASGASGVELRNVLRMQSNRTMREQAWDLVNAGRTDETEIERVFGAHMA